jgi:hypothetical protein
MQEAGVGINMAVLWTFGMGGFERVEGLKCDVWIGGDLAGCNDKLAYPNNIVPKSVHSVGLPNVF